jgi:hypothetical protein
MMFEMWGVECIMKFVGEHKSTGLFISFEAIERRRVKRAMLLAGDLTLLACSAYVLEH